MIYTREETEEISIRDAMQEIVKISEENKDEYSKLFHDKHDLMRIDISRRKSSAKAMRNTNRKRFDSGYLYVIKAMGKDLYKIGVTSNPKRRVLDIRAGMPYYLNVIYLQHYDNVFNLEEFIDDCLKDYALLHEWYVLDDKAKLFLISALEYIKENDVVLNKRL